MGLRRQKTPEQLAEALVDAQYELVCALADDRINDRIRNAVEQAADAIIERGSQAMGDALVTLADWEIEAMAGSDRDRFDEVVARVRTDFGTEEPAPTRPANENAQICSHAIVLGVMRDEMYGGKVPGASEAVNAVFALGDDLVYTTLRVSSAVVAHLLLFDLLSKRQMRG